MSDDTSNNKCIAKNTIMLYLRMLITMIVGLYVSLEVLVTLGVVSMMGLLNASMFRDIINTSLPHE